MKQWPAGRLLPVGARVRILTGPWAVREAWLRHWCVFEFKNVTDTFAVVELADDPIASDGRMVLVRIPEIAVVAN